MNKAQLIAEFGSAAGVARFFSITDQAVNQWPADLPIPRERLLELQLRRPDLFPDGPIIPGNRTAVQPQ